MQHIIQYQMFDVEFSNAGKSYDLQNKISDIFNNQLTSGMEQLFNRLAPADTTLTLNEINIDVGSIPYDMLEYELTDKVLAELEKEIRYRLFMGQNTSSETQSEGQEVKSVKVSYSNLLEYFLLTGTMPWWATGELMVDPAKVMDYLLAEDAAALTQLIIKTGQQGYVRQRLVQQFSEQVIHRIISLLEPTEASFIFNYHATVVKVHQEEKLIESAGTKEFENELWVFILTYILVDRGSLFNQKLFVKSTLAQMASHYNRSYAELLTLLAIALNNNQLLAKQSSYLPQIIEELFTEESDSRDSNPVVDNVAVVQQDIELLKQYLVFGTLPWWAQPYGADSIAALFLGLIKTAPKALNKLIKTIGQSDDVRKRITTVFDDEVMTAVVKLLEPANGEFIISYVAEVQQLHVKKAIVNTDNKDFKKAVWKFVFDFLLVERGSEFNERMFLQSNIRMLANNYNVQYSDMLIYFVQSISQLHQDSVGHAPLFKLLAGLLQDLDQQSVKPEQQAISSKKQTDSKRTNRVEQLQRAVVLKDVLLHWLSYGNIPWWGKMYFDWTPSAMMEALLATAPNDAALLLQFAGTNTNMQQRVIYQFAAPLIVNILKLYPQGDEAIELYVYLLKAAHQPEAEKLILLAAWNVFINGQYKTFNAGAFIQSVVSYLVQQYDVKVPVILNAIKEALGTDKKYTGALNEIQRASYSTNNEWMPLDESIETTDINQAINNYLTEKNITGSRAIFEEALQILEYYLANNKLPQQFKGTNPAYVNAMVKQLLLFLNKADDTLLKQKLADAGKMDLYSLIDPDQEYAEIDGGVEQMISSYLLEAKSVQTENVIDEALRILAYFLINGKMPEYLNRIDTRHTLKQLFILLNYEKPSALNSLLQKDGHIAVARMQVHNIFAITTNTAENNVRTVLRSYFEQDALLYIKQLAGTDLGVDEKLTDLMVPYLQQPQKHIDFIIAVLKQPAMARYIALNYTNELVYGLLNTNSSIVGGSENLSWLKQLHQLFNLSLTDTLVKDQFNILFMEFNLLMLGGHINAKTPAAYLRAFFRFISSANYSLFIRLSNALLKPEQALSAVATPIPLVLQELNAFHQNDQHRITIQKLLVKADQQALQHITGPETDQQKNDETKELKDELANKQQLADEADKEKNKETLMNNKDTVYINNAGLVLLNPFLSTYFVRLGMMHEGKFIDADKQLRAVHLLQYLVNGEQQSAEHELVLNKVLCNVPAEDAVPLGIIMTDMEKAISEELLKVVINRWDKLKNTSIEGLQESFLQRSGALVFKDDAWHLRVEQRGYDVLLQTLPWTIGMIKTPWMDNFLYVEWT
jgi:hypothetical protein